MTKLISIAICALIITGCSEVVNSWVINTSEDFCKSKVSSGK